MLENKEEIVLDAANNVLVGPNGYFKIVVDDFDGQTINAWHWEGPNGEISDNLASFSNGRHLDAIINRPNSTVNNLLVNYLGINRLMHYLPNVPAEYLIQAE